MIDADDHFDPQKMQAENMKKEQAAAVRKAKLRKWAVRIIIPLLVIGGLYAVGGTGRHGDWQEMKEAFAPVAAGGATEAELGKLIICYRKIDDVRGNRSALAGVLTVYALEQFKRGNFFDANKAIKLLKRKFSDIKYFAGLWNHKSLIKSCPVCSGGQKYITCPTCKGTGRVCLSSGTDEQGLRPHHLRSPSGTVKQRLRSRHLHSPSGKPADTEAGIVCQACHGTGKIKAVHGVCEKCGGRGRGIDSAAIDRNLEKAVKRTELLLRFKSLQTLL